MSDPHIIVCPGCNFVFNRSHYCPECGYKVYIDSESRYIDERRKKKAQVKEIVDTDW